MRDIPEEKEMTQEQLQERITKKEQDISKIEKRIAKWSKGLRQSDIDICKPFGDCIYGTAPRNINWRDYDGTEEFQVANKNYHNYLEINKDIPSSEDWSKGPNIGELYNAYRDLGEARHTLKNYQDTLANMLKFEGEEKVEVIWKFLMNWKELSREWYRKNVKRYFELKRDYEKAKAEFYAKYDNKPAYYLRSEFERNYFFNIDSVTREIANIKGQYKDGFGSEWEYVSYSVNEELLEKYLDREVKAKYKALIVAITDITGVITDASGLRIGGKGDINGVVKGEKGVADVNTFSAGGWNIQCFHYRTKITDITSKVAAATKKEEVKVEKADATNYTSKYLCPVDIEAMVNRGWNKIEGYADKQELINKGYKVKLYYNKQGSFTLYK